jgi:hypothetical protein
VNYFSTFDLPFNKKVRPKQQKPIVSKQENMGILKHS